MTPALLDRLRCLFAWLVLIAGGWGGAVWAQEAPLDLAQLPERSALVSRLQLLVDREAALDPAEALRQPGWAAATTRQLNQGSTAAALWLRLDLGNHGPAELTRWLSMGNPRLEQVQLYRFDVASGLLLEQQQSGMAYPPAVRLARGRDAVFSFTLMPGERHTLLLRVQSRTVMGMQPELWAPLHYLEQEELDDLLYLLPIGMMSGLVLYLLANTLARGHHFLFLYALWLLLGAAYDFAFQGYLRRYLMPDGGDLAARLPHLLGLLAAMMMSFYIHAYLEMGRRGWWGRFFPAVTALLAVFALLTLFGDLRWAIGKSTGVLILFHLIWPLALIQPWREGMPHVRLFTLALSCVWLFTLLRVASVMGLLQPSSVMGFLHLSSLAVLYLAVLFKFFMTCVLLYVVVRHSVSESRALATMQAELLDAQHMEQQRLEEAVRVRSAALRQAAVDADEAVRAKGELLARVGHDLRAPLTAIMAYAARLEAASGAVRQLALAIGRSAREQLALINGLIEYARAGVQPDAVLPQPLYLKAWLRSIADQAVALAARQGNHFEFRIEGDLPDVVLLDAKRARQVLELLLTHAAERTHQGQVELRVEPLPSAGPEPDEPIRLLFTVRDDGPAIAADQLPTLFQPFLRLGLDQSHHEVGLGLAIAHQWAQRMGGRLQASSQPEGGATLRLTLPMPRSSEEAIAPRRLQRQEAQLPELRGAGRRLWLVDDSPVVRELLMADFSDMGFEFKALTDGREALLCLRDPQAQAPDLLLTDLRMPGADGLTLLRNARARWPDLPVVLLTSAPEVVADLRHDFSAVLAKPISRAQLRRTLAELLGLELSETVPTEEAA